MQLIIENCEVNLKTIDFFELKKYKGIILGLSNSSKITPEEDEALQVVLTLIDSIQDDAIERYNLPPSQVLLTKNLLLICHFTTRLAMDQTLSSRILKMELVNWKELKFIQQDTFKELPSEAKNKLKNSILKNDFTQPFYVWQDRADGVIYCLDGKHRTLILEELVKESYHVPDLLPATFIDCKDKKEAAHLVLIYSSIYAKISNQGLFDFLQLFELEYNSIKDQMDIPELSLQRFEQRFDQFSVEDEDEYIHPEEVYVKEGDLFEINGHRVICADSTDPDSLDKLTDGQTVQLLFTSPPYNMNAGLYSEYSDNLTANEYVEMNKNVILNCLRHISGYLFYNISYNKNTRSEFIDILYFLKNIPQTLFLELIVWNKKTALPIVSNELLTRQFEQIPVLCTDEAMEDMDVFYLGSNKRKIFFNKRIGRTMSNFWEVPVTSSKIQFESHSACFPLELPMRAIQLTTKEGESVIDPFFGMGTTLIAADVLNRKFLGVELKPAYVQGGLQRFIKYCYRKSIDVNFKHLNGSLTLKDFQHEYSIIN